MVRSLYARLLAFQCLLAFAGGFVFWLLNINYEWPDPMAILATIAFCLIVAAVVIGLLLDPVDRLHLAIKHAARGEEVPLPEPRAKDLRELLEAVITLKSLAYADASELSGVINSLSEGTLIFDRHWRLLHINTSLRSMAAEEGITAGPDGNLAPYCTAFHARCFVPEQLDLIDEEMRKAPDRPRTDIIQLDRPRQFLKRYGAPLYNQKGERTGMLVSYTDITHDVEIDRLRQDFIANASHELRTPVTSVKVLLENLVDGAKDDPAVRDDFLDDALREIDRMHELVNDLLDLAALESARNTLEISRFELVKVIEEAVATVSPQAKQKGVTIAAEAIGVSLEADHKRIRQVLVNLVTNAVKFTPAGGTVSVRAWEDGTVARVSISDTGIGIPAKDLPHIFDRFFRVTRGRSRLQGGSGLGLTIVKQAIDAHRGEIAVESTEGQGTAFTITLPREHA
ncbi:MAG TPA: ATP-binding protein [Oscillatoriaceae cyanobacterium]